MIIDWCCGCITSLRMIIEGPPGLAFKSGEEPLVQRMMSSAYEKLLEVQSQIAKHSYTEREDIDTTTHQYKKIIPPPQHDATRLNALINDLAHLNDSLVSLLAFHQLTSNDDATFSIGKAPIGDREDSATSKNLFVEQLWIVCHQSLQCLAAVFSKSIVLTRTFQRAAIRTIDLAR